MSDVTKELLGLAEHRFLGVLHSVLSTHFHTSSEYSALLEKPVDEDDFYWDGATMLLKAIESEEFPRQLARSLIAPFHELVGTEIVNHLVLSTRSAFANFGIFVREVSTGMQTVSFDPDLVLDSCAIRKTIRWKSRVHRSADNISVQELQARTNTNLPKLMRRIALHEGQRLPYMAAEIAETVLPSVLHLFVHQRFIRNLVKTNEPKKGRNKSRQRPYHWFSMISVPMAVTTYYSWILALAYGLRTTPEIEIEGVGYFHMTRAGAAGHKVGFEPSPGLLQLLAANVKLSPLKNRDSGSGKSGSSNSVKNKVPKKPAMPDAA